MSSQAVVAPRNALNFFALTGKLKTLKRTGWVDNEIYLPESVADHMYRMSMLVFMLVDPAINKDLLIKVCLVHDLAEADVGDITPHAGVSKEEKRRLEETALKKIISDIDNDAIGSELLNLWLIYEEGNTVEASVAKQLDKFEMIVQANEYELSNSGKKLDSFFKSTAEAFSHPEIVSWNALLREDRDKRWSSSV